MMFSDVSDDYAITNIDCDTVRCISDMDIQESISMLTESALKEKLTCSIIPSDISHRFHIYSKCMVVKRRVKGRYLHENLVFYGFLLLTVLLPSSLSLPQQIGKRSLGRTSSFADSSRLQRSATDTAPHWINPCNGTSSSSEKASSYESMNSDSDFINAVKVTAKQAKHQAEKFRDEYVLKMFGTNLKDHHKTFKNQKYEWLNKVIHKDLGEPLSREHLDKLQLEEEALKIYGYLQRLAVAFEQLVLDHRNTNSPFKGEFIMAENNLRRILCEVLELIPNEKLNGFENAKRDLMQDHLRHMTHQSERHFRDWLIFRDYMNLVEYIEEVMEHFESMTIK